MRFAHRGQGVLAGDPRANFVVLNAKYGKHGVADEAQNLAAVGQDGPGGTLEIGFQGAEVNVRRRRLLPDAEPKIGETLTRYVHNEGITVTCGVAYGDIGRSETGVALSMQIDGVSHTVKAEQVLVCTGRRPNTQGLVLADAGL